MPRLARGRADIPMLSVATLIAVVVGVVVASGATLAVRGAVATIGIVGITVLFVAIRRLELTLLVLFPLLTVVAIEPAFVDFLIVGLVVALAIRRESGRFVPPRIVLAGLILLVVSYAASLLAPPDVNAAIRFTVATLLVVATGYVAFQLAARDPAIATRAYVLAALLLFAQTIVAFVLSPFSDAVFLWYDPFRVEGLFKDPNVFGPFAVPAVALLCAGRPAMHPVARVGCIALALVPVAASVARGAVLALIMALVLLAAIALYRRWSSILFYSLGILGLGLVAFLVLIALPGSSVAQHRFTSVLEHYDTEIRFAGQLAGLDYFLSHPLSPGVGPGNYNSVLGDPSHETYLRLLVETGPFSLIAILLLMWAAIRFVRSRDPTAVAWAVALAGFATYAFLIDELHWRHLWVLLAMPLAIAAHAAEARRTSGEETQTS